MAPRGVVSRECHRSRHDAPRARRRDEPPDAFALRQSLGPAARARARQPRAEAGACRRGDAPLDERVARAGEAPRVGARARRARGADAPGGERCGDAAHVAPPEARLRAPRLHARHAPPRAERARRAPRRQTPRVRLGALRRADARGTAELDVAGEAPPGDEAERELTPGGGQRAARGAARGDHLQPRPKRSLSPAHQRVARRGVRAARQRLRLAARGVARRVAHAGAPGDEEARLLRGDALGDDARKRGAVGFRGVHALRPLAHDARRDAHLTHERDVVAPARGVVREVAPRERDPLDQAPRTDFLEPPKRRLAPRLERARQSLARRRRAPRGGGGAEPAAAAHRGVALQRRARVAREYGPVGPDARARLHLAPPRQVPRRALGASALLALGAERVERDAPRRVAARRETALRLGGGGVAPRFFQTLPLARRVPQREPRTQHDASPHVRLAVLEGDAVLLARRLRRRAPPRKRDAAPPAELPPQARLEQTLDARRLRLQHRRPGARGAEQERAAAARGLARHRDAVARALRDERAPRSQETSRRAARARAGAPRGARRRERRAFARGARLLRGGAPRLEARRAPGAAQTRGAPGGFRLAPRLGELGVSRVAPNGECGAEREPPPPRDVGVDDSALDARVARDGAPAARDAPPLGAPEALTRRTRETIFVRLRARRLEPRARRRAQDADAPPQRERARRAREAR